MQKSLEVFKDVVEKKSPFRKGRSHSQNKPHCGGRYYYAWKPGNRDQQKHGKFQIPFQHISGRTFEHGMNFHVEMFFCYYVNIPLLLHRVNTSSENLKVPSSSNSKLLPLASMALIHPVVRKLFTEEIPNVPLAGRLSQFVKQWEKVTHDQEILSIVIRYQMPFTNLSIQEKPNTTKMSEQLSLLVDQEISELLEKGAIQKVQTAQEKFISNIFVVGKNDGGNYAVINLKKLNPFIRCEHFKIEGLNCLKFLLEQNDFLCKIDLKDAYFPIPLSKQSSKYVRFKWSGNLYEFLCLCYGLG